MAIYQVNPTWSWGVLHSRSHSNHSVDMNNMYTYSLSWDTHIFPNSPWDHHHTLALCITLHDRYHYDIDRRGTCLPSLQFIIIDAVVFHDKEIILLVATRSFVLHVPVVLTRQHVVISRQFTQLTKLRCFFTSTQNRSLWICSFRTISI